MRRADSFGKTLMWGKIEGKIAQLDGHGWTPRVGDGMLQFMGSQRVSSSHEVAKVLEFELQHQSF